jgi:hypothetical protein
MTRDMAMVLFTLGLVITFGAVGGIENDGPLLDCLIVAIVGLGIMGCGSLAISVLESK